MLIQELVQRGRPRKNKEPFEVTPQMWEKISQSPVGRKRFRKVQPPKAKAEGLNKPKDEGK